MSDQIYKKLCETMAARGGQYPGMDIPEFYPLARELFTPDEAAVSAAMPRKPSPADVIAQEMGRAAVEVSAILETMADKGLCNSFVKDGIRLYAGPPFVPGIFEFQFMKGTRTDRDRKLARLIHAYKEAVAAKKGHRPLTFPINRVIAVEQTIQAGSTVHTYDQVSSYIDQFDSLAVSTCFCRHEGKLLDEKSDCGKPDDVCMQFGVGAEYVIERGFGRRITKDEARQVLKRSEEAGLVHASSNTQDLDFICNCCPCHCMILKTALAQPQPGRILLSGFQPGFDPDRCVACGTCVERCPAKALTLDGDLPELNLDRCFGCGVCATGCPSEAIAMVERAGASAPPVNRKALSEAIQASRK